MIHSVLKLNEVFNFRGKKNEPRQDTTLRYTPRWSWSHYQNFYPYFLFHPKAKYGHMFLHNGRLTHNAFVNFCSLNLIFTDTCVGTDTKENFKVESPSFEVPNLFVAIKT